ncbi:MAG TPA: preprotein translocase subunit YajC [Chromatiaceae bacterium]|jgi:preprotein translocase subunit YajC|nr:MAG: preprotein translocase subunit YajC [Thiohalocapsa sp. PB-PSB1]QQO52212.1 MAG: preprotein translocase subunit YajC [Thiohalocapsa sp. PB-PSB1]HBG95752.1 preprotein translocase subunit YajC [Chromatiaceae bacterium]HCS89147.1 preprotein translocase subunit YajC [Chromatiaceae bacterium]
MSFFISDAMAQTGGAPGDSLWGLLFPIGLIVILYFLMIRPQIKRQKEHKALVDGLSKGDEVITMGGIAGRVVDLGDSFAQVEVADKVVVKLRRQAVEAVLPKGSLKEL